MSVLIARTPVRVATYRVLQIGALCVGAIAAVVTAIATGSLSYLLLAPVIWFALFYGLREYYPEPALDEWDSLPKATRIALLDTLDPAAVQLAAHDKDSEVRRYHRAMLRKLVK